MKLRDIQSKTLVRLVDDDPDLLEATAILLEYAGWKVAAYPSAELFLNGNNSDIPGVALVDLKLPEMNGIELLVKINDGNSKIPVVLVSGHGDIDTAVLGMKLGARDFIQKPAKEDDLLKTVETYATESFCMFNDFVTPEKFDKAWRDLTDRERQVLSLIIQDLPTNLISERLGISVRTVHEHRAEIFRKLGARKLDFVKDRPKIQ